MKKERKELLAKLLKEYKASKKVIKQALFQRKGHPYALTSAGGGYSGTIYDNSRGFDVSFYASSGKKTFPYPAVFTAQLKQKYKLEYLIDDGKGTPQDQKRYLQLDQKIKKYWDSLDLIVHDELEAFDKKLNSSLQKAAKAYK